MERRKALAVAGTTAATVAIVAGSLAANFGLVGADPSPGVGELDAQNVATLVGDAEPTATSTGIDPGVVYQDESVVAPTAATHPGHDRDELDEDHDGHDDNGHDDDDHDDDHHDDHDDDHEDRDDD
jgi:hypothetical protein